MGPGHQWHLATANYEFGGEADLDASLARTKARLEGMTDRRWEIAFLGSVTAAAHSIGLDDLFEMIEFAATRALDAIGETQTTSSILARLGAGLSAVNHGDAALAKAQYEPLQESSGKFNPGALMSYDRVLGLLASTFGDRETAAGHFEDALAFAGKAGYVRETVWTKMEYAEMLLDRVEAGSHTGAAERSGRDREKAIELQDEALAITRELGMRPLTERILKRREILRA